MSIMDIDKINKTPPPIKYNYNNTSIMDHDMDHLLDGGGTI